MENADKNKISNGIRQVIATLFFSFSLMGVALGIVYFLRAASSKPEFYWNLILLSFIIGTLILTIRPDTLDKKWREPYPRLGFLIILSGIFVLIGNGVSLFSIGVGNLIIGFGIIMFSAGLSFLLTVLGSHIVKI